VKTGKLCISAVKLFSVDSVHIKKFWKKRAQFGSHTTVSVQ